MREEGETYQPSVVSYSYDWLKCVLHSGQLCVTTRLALDMFHGLNM